MLRNLVTDFSLKMSAHDIVRMMSGGPKWPPPPFPKLPPLSEYQHLTNHERRNQGFPCDYDEPTMKADELKARTLIQEFNRTNYDQLEKRNEILKKLLHPETGKGVHIEPPFFVDYGNNIKLGEGGFINYNCILLDTAPITIGKYVLIAPRVSIFTTNHDLDPTKRSDYGIAKPVKIGDNVWLGGASTILPGITIGDGCIVAGGAVVTKNVPAYCIVGGNPAKIVRYLPGAKEPKK